MVYAPNKAIDLPKIVIATAINGILLKAILKIKGKFITIAFKSDNFKGGNQEKKKRVYMKYEAKKKKGAIEKVEYSYRNIGKMTVW